MLPGKTIAFLGSSGVGKSSIINYLFGEERQRTGSVSSSNGKGRHTTTSKELFFHQTGCMLIDTPGLRELQLWGEEDVLGSSFQDIYDIAEGCRFHDCKHEREPGCAVLKSIEEGTLSHERYENYKKQLGELQYLSKAKKQFEINMNRKMKKKGGI
jgi:ribosome biogenesis GTPase